MEYERSDLNFIDKKNKILNIPIENKIHKMVFENAYHQNIKINESNKLV